MLPGYGDLPRMTWDGMSGDERRYGTMGCYNTHIIIQKEDVVKLSGLLHDF
jgi:hypothetical protein